VRTGIDSISLNPDSIVGILQRVVKIEKELQENLTTIAVTQQEEKIP
jgi:hypothetical protein